MLFKISLHCRDTRHLNKSFPFTDRKMTVYLPGENTQASPCIEFGLSSSALHTSENTSYLGE